jgi:ubiquinone/menaquinone biosynthesis C-methylase UbiE
VTDRSSSRELLDRGAYRDLAELRDNLRDIARYDRWLGVFRLQLRLAMAAPDLPASGWSATGLDVGAGAAEFLRYAHGVSTMRWIGLDLSGDVLRVAAPAVAGALVRADGRHLPFSDGSIDVVTSAHTLHHLDPDDARSLLSECARVARRRVVVVDLARGRTAVAGAWLLTRLTSRNRLTRADGLLSARRAYTPNEVELLAARAGLFGAAVQRHGPARMSLVWDK